MITIVQTLWLCCQNKQINGSGSGKPERAPIIYKIMDDKGGALINAVWRVIQSSGVGTPSGTAPPWAKTCSDLGPAA